MRGTGLSDIVLCLQILNKIFFFFFFGGGGGGGKGRSRGKGARESDFLKRIQI